MDITKLLRGIWRWFTTHFSRLSGWGWFFLVVQFITAVVSALLWKHLPAPGWSVAILAFVAATMSIHGDMKDWQRGIWMILIGVLLVIELRAINRDRTETHNEAMADRAAQSAAFQETLDALTGGNSYATIMPALITNNPENAEFPLLVSVIGKNALFDVSIEMQDGSLDQQSTQYFISHIKEYLEGKVRRTFHFNSISATFGQPLGFVVHPSPNQINVYNFWIFSRNKPTREELRMRFNRTKNRWEIALKASRDGDSKPLSDVDFVD